MPAWLMLSNSIFTRFAVVLLLLGLLRLSLITVWDLYSAVRRAGDRRLPYGQILRETLSWTFPVRRIHRARRLYSYSSFLLHTGILLVGLFLGNHLDILQANFGVKWPTLAKPLLDLLTLAAIAAGSFLLGHRVYVSSSRQLSRPMDYLLLGIILNILISGFLAGQFWNPIRYNSLMLFHAVNGIVLLILIPYTKIAHCVLYPLVRLGTEAAWHLPPQGGSEAVKTLHGIEGRRI
jgi:nitrate reductase gamma subunit